MSIQVGTPVQLGRLRTAAGITIVAGQPGLSAYQLAVVDGFDGTLEEWLDSLHGTGGGGGGGGIDDVPGLQDALDDEAMARAGADAALDLRVDVLEGADPVPDLTDGLAAEASTRAAADTALDGRLDVVEARPVPDVTAADLATHAADTTGVHGITDTSALIVEGDARLTDARTPTAHTHPSSAITDFTSAVDARVQNIVGAAPAALDTLAELAEALGDDPDFAASVTTALAGKEPLKSADDNYVTDAEKAALHSHSNKAALDQVSGVNTGDQTLPTWSTIAGKPAVVAAGADAAAARSAIGLGTAATAASTDFAAASHNHDSRYYTESEVDALIAGVSGGSGLTAPQVLAHVWIGA